MADTLLGLFGGQRAPEVSFDTATAWDVDDLLVAEDDTLSAIARKMDRCREIVENGGSLAVALGSLPREGGTIDYGKAAYDEMTPGERTQYEAWAKGAQLPPLRQEEDRADPNASKAGRTRDERRLVWLKRAYKNDKLDAHNLAFFQKNFATLIPLLCAGAKVVGQERAATNNTTRDARYLAEQVAAARLAGAASARQNTIQAEVARLNQQIASGVQALQARKEAMRPEEGAGRKRQVPANVVRSAVGLPPLGNVSKWGKEGAAGRGQRFLTGPSGGGGTAGVRRPAGDEMDVDRPAQKRARQQPSGRGRGPTPGPSSQRGGGRPGLRSSGPAHQKEQAGPSRSAVSPVYRPRSPGAERESSAERASVEFQI